MKEVGILAVDAGGTTCRAALCSKRGEILDYVQGGSCNYHSIGIEKATSTLAGVFACLTPKQGLRVNCVVLALAGLDTQKDQLLLTMMVRQALDNANIIADRIYLDNDAMLTLKGMVGLKDGVIIVAGTGSIACGIGKDGKEFRVGGWGYRIGDEGSGYSIGKAAITHILRAYDGRDEASGISPAILETMSLCNEEELLNWIYSTQFSVGEIAALAPIIIALAEKGDSQSLRIIKKSGEELGEMTLTVVRKLCLTDIPFQLIMSGGLFGNVIIQQQFVGWITARCRAVQLVIPKDEPICAILCYGLLLLGMGSETLGRELAGQLKRQLIKKV